MAEITFAGLAEFLDIDPRSMSMTLGVQRKFGRWYATLTGPGFEVVGTADNLEDAVINVLELYSKKPRKKR